MYLCERSSTHARDARESCVKALSFSSSVHLPSGIDRDLTNRRQMVPEIVSSIRGESDWRWLSRSLLHFSDSTNNKFSTDVLPNISFFFFPELHEDDLSPKNTQRWLEASFLVCFFVCFFFETLTANIQTPFLPIAPTESERERERDIMLTLPVVIPTPILVVSEMVHVNKASRTTETQSFVWYSFFFSPSHVCLWRNCTAARSAVAAEVISYWIIASWAKNQSHTVSKRTGPAEIKWRFVFWMREGAEGVCSSTTGAPCTVSYLHALLHVTESQLKWWECRKRQTALTSCSCNRRSSLVWH